VISPFLWTKWQLYLQKKLNDARQLSGGVRIVRDIKYSTAESAQEPLNRIRAKNDLDDFDKRLKD
jgi:hypothetical protein